MSDEKNTNNESDERPQLESLDLTSVRHFIDLVQNQNQSNLNNLERNIDGKIDTLSSQIGEMHRDLRDHIASIENKTNTKFDTFDVALRGNGRIGIFEQIRAIKVKQRIIGIIIILLLGAKIWGYTLDDWFKDTFLNKEDEAGQVESAEINDEFEVALVLDEKVEE